MSSHTCPWSEANDASRCNDSDTDRDLRARILCAMTFPDCSNAGEEYPQRPCSVQLTGTLVSDCSLMSTEVFNTRFCLAPASSSPSTSSTALAPRLTTSNSGTEP